MFFSIILQMEEIKQFIRTRKPDIAEQTLKNYASTLRTLYTNLFPNEELNIKKFLEKDVEFYVDYVKSQGKSKSYIRNNLSALQVIFKNKELTKAITENSLSEQEDARNPIASDYVKSHHLTQDVIDAKYEELKNIAEPLWNKSRWEITDFQKIQDFVMFALVCGKFIAPRRSRDWYDFKLRNIDLEKDNYLDKKVFVFNAYKTGKLTGQQRIDVPPELYRILRKWIRFNKLPWLFVNVKFEPLTAVSYAQKLNKIMGVPSGQVGG